MGCCENVQFAAKLLRKYVRKLAKWYAKWRIKLNSEKATVIIFSRSPLARNSGPILKLYGERLKIYFQVKFLGITFDSKFTSKALPRALQHQVPSTQTFSQQKMGTQPVHHITNLRRMCPAKYLIWLSFDHNNI